jgi:heat shock protein HslJ
VTPAGPPAPIQANWLLPDRGSHPTLTFSAERNAISGSTGCNQYFGEFSASQDRLSLGGLATTMMMCFEDLAVQEITYMDALSKVTGYANNGTSLTLTTNDGRQLVFTPLSPAVAAQAANQEDRGAAQHAP